MVIYKYGMIHRGFSIGAQPNGVILSRDADKEKEGFYSIIYYDRKLTEEEINKYELVALGEGL